MGITYRDAGVDIDAGERLVDAIKPLAKATHRAGVMGGIGGFAGLFRVPKGMKEPVLVSGTDGVGTKLKTAFAVGRHDTIGIDLVAMSVNDVAVTGAEPLFFLDYFATSALDVAVATDVIAGVAEGCRQAKVALLGGETAELPGLYQASEYDVAGFCVGVIEADELRDGSDLAAGDVVFGLPSTGLHSNGHSLARKVILEVLGHSFTDAPADLGGSTIGDELLRPTAIYIDSLAALRSGGIRFKGAAHITGGGLIDNPPRMLPTDELAFSFDTTTWAVPPIFSLIASAGIELAEMRRTFNMGIGMVVVVSAEQAAATHDLLVAHGGRAIGALIPRGDGPAVRFR